MLKGKQISHGNETQIIICNMTTANSKINKTTIHNIAKTLYDYTTKKVEKLCKYEQINSKHV